MAKRRGRGTGCLYKRGNVWWMHAKTPYGEIRESTGKVNKGEAEAYLQDRLAKYRQGEGEGAVRSLTLSDLYKSVVQFYQLHKLASLRDIEHRWELHLKPEFGERKLHTIKSQHITAYQVKRQEEGATNGTINRELALFRRCYLLKDNRKRAGHIPAFDMLPEAKARDGFLDDKEFEALKEAARKRGHEWLANFIEVAGRIANRKSELLKLHVSDCDLKAGVVVFRNTKNGDNRRVFMPPTVKAALTAQCKGQPKDANVFRWKTGVPVKDFRKLWANICEDIGKPELLVHDLRRTAVRNMRDAGVPEETAMLISGHKTRAVFQRYNIGSDARLAEAAKLIG